MINLTFTGSIDTGILQQELINAIGPQSLGWYLNGSLNSVTFIATVDSIADPTVIIHAHIADSLSRLKNLQIAELSSDCANSIYKGFQSSALGAVYTYPFKDLDQSNLNASVTNSLLPNLPTGWTTPFWCADSNNVWLMRQHTAAQIQQVGIDATSTKLAAIEKNFNLANQVMAATTPDAIEAIVW